MNPAARRLAALGVLALVSACSSTRAADRDSAPMRAAAAAPPANVPGDVPSEATPAPAPPPSSEPPPSSGANAAVPACLPSQSVSKPKHRHKRTSKGVAKAAPPAQSETAHAAAETPPGALINADVAELGSSVMSILGKKVQGPKGEDLGRVVDVLADASGRVRVAVIDFGGFLGVGTRRIAVDWPLLRFNPTADDKPVLLSLSREKLQSAPEYKDSTHPKVLMLPVAASPAAADASAANK